MRIHPRILLTLAGLTVASALVFAPDYKLTVSQDRLNNAMNEPQNWLLMNGDYGSTRYSKLTQINRENVRNLRMVWALALGGMQDVGQNGPENEVNPLIDNGFMYTTDGWGTVYKIDASKPDQGKFVWIADPASGTRATRRAPAASRSGKIACSPICRTAASSRSTATTARSSGTRGSPRRTNSAARSSSSPRRSWPTARSSSRTAPATAAPAAGSPRSTSRPATSCGASTSCRSRAIRAAKRGRTITTPGRPAAAASGRPAPTIRPPSSTSSAPAIRIPIYDPQFRPGDNLYTNSVIALNVDTGKLAWHFQYTPNDSWDFDEVGVHMLYDTTINGEKRKVVGHYARNGFYYTLDRTNGKFIKAEKYVNDLNWTKGIDQKTGKPLEYSPKLDVQIYNPDGARAARRRQEAGVPDLARRHRPPAAGLQPDQEHRLRRRHRRLLHAERRRRRVASARRRHRHQKASEPRQYSSDLYYGAVTAFDAANHKVLAKAVTDIEIRSGVTATAGGLVFSALQDGWVVAYNDETLEELWRFNLGTPLKGSPVTYAIGPKQYLAVQTSGRHLHPVKFDNLENSSYLFVFALN